MHEVERAVDRINDPEVVALGGADAAGFFRQNGVIGIGVLQAVDDGGFGGAVGGGHEIVDGLVFNFEGVEARGGAGDFRGGATGGLDGDGDIRRFHTMRNSVGCKTFRRTTGEQRARPLSTQTIILADQRDC